MYDDGGLTLLLPYLLSMHHDWTKTNMRIMVISINSAINHELPYMTRLLHKFRIKAEIVPVVMSVGPGGIVEDIEGPVLSHYWHLLYNRTEEESALALDEEEEEKTQHHEDFPDVCVHVAGDTSVPVSPATKPAALPVNPAALRGLMSMFVNPDQADDQVETSAPKPGTARGDSGVPILTPVATRRARSQSTAQLEDNAELPPRTKR